MSLKVIVCLFIFGFIHFVQCAQFQTEPYQHPDYPGQCYDKDTNEPVPVGTATSDSKGCKWQKCQSDFTLVGSTCAPVGQPVGCTVTKPDLTKPYPKCCPQLICNNN